ncbi:DUF6249 domain-containing protein [Phocaeicola sp.]
MMDFIMVPTIMAIITLGVYKLFELFVCKKERLTIIEKMGDRFSPDMLEHKINFSSLGNFSFSALKIGCLLMGMGLGLLIGYLICVTTVVGYWDYSVESWKYNGTVSLVYGASVLFFGGLGLIAAFIVELKYKK